MKKTTETIIKFISLVLVLVFLCVGIFYLVLFLRCFSDAKKISPYPKYPVMRVLFYGASKDTVSARFMLYDTAEHEIAVIERSWTGDSLSVVFTSSVFDGKEFIFPYRIQSEKSTMHKKTPIQHGTNIEQFYMENRRCYLLGFPHTDKERKAFYYLALFSFWQAKRFQSQYSKVYKLELAGLEPGQTYEILVNVNGLVQLVQM